MRILVEDYVLLPVVGKKRLVVYVLTDKHR